MKIIILGAGQVGSTVAQSLASEANDITVVDRSPPLLMALQERTDIRTVVGHASHPDVLREAGIEDADMVLAVTNSDEINMIACQVAHSLFHTPIRLARVRSLDYLAHPQIFRPEAVPIDFIISPEQLVTTFIRHLIDSPGVLQILDFANGMAQLVAVQAQPGGALVGKELRSLNKWKPAAETRVVAIYRHDRAIFPEGETVIEVGDEVFFLAAHQHIRTLVTAFRQSDKRTRRVIIAATKSYSSPAASAASRSMTRVSPSSSRTVAIGSRPAGSCGTDTKTKEPGRRVGLMVRSSSSISTAPLMGTAWRVALLCTRQ